jgi:hypothetical protein
MSNRCSEQSRTLSEVRKEPLQHFGPMYQNEALALTNEGGVEVAAAH